MESLEIGLTWEQVDDSSSVEDSLMRYWCFVSQLDVF